MEKPRLWGVMEKPRLWGVMEKPRLWGVMENWLFEIGPYCRLRTFSPQLDGDRPAARPG